ncbi:MAG: GNAT family N-acetyltransferase [Orrella sp.]|jgi:GNAT superfamily N-acetyltransferase|uniref:GNAT family N-acetyltransferase n=1 Tax=Orrella sp. TaxID=1921583 RepID=UPI003BE7DE41
MHNASTSFVSAKQLSKRAVTQFYDTLLSRPHKTENPSDEKDKFEGDGIALMVDGELRGMYTYKAFASIQANTTLYYPYGGVLGDDPHTTQHRALIQALSRQLKSDFTTQIIICLDQQPMQAVDKTVQCHAFWCELGFTLLDVQVFYQGPVKVDDTKIQSDFSVRPYSGGDHAINTELCDLYRDAYKRRLAIPDVTVDSIDKQLAMAECMYLIMHKDSTLIGQVTLFVDNKDCYVDSIYVKRRYWGTGAADVLTQTLFAYAEKHGCETISGVAASNNWASRGLMARFGLVAQHQTTRMVLTL